MDWIINNKEWLFSGIGVALLTFLTSLFIRSKKETNNDRKVITEKDISIKKNKVDSEITKNEKEKISTNQKLEDSENRTTNKTEVKKDTVKK